jgi:hypothetical protein
MIIAALNGAFDSSAVVMFAFGQAVDVFNIPFQLVCLAYLVVPVTIFICSLFLFPDEVSVKNLSLAFYPVFWADFMSARFGNVRSPVCLAIWWCLLPSSFVVSSYCQEEMSLKTRSQH